MSSPNRYIMSEQSLRCETRFQVISIYLPYCTLCILLRWVNVISLFFCFQRALWVIGVTGCITTGMVILKGQELARSDVVLRMTWSSKYVCETFVCRAQGHSLLCHENTLQKAFLCLYGKSRWCKLHVERSANSKATFVTRSYDFLFSLQLVQNIGIRWELLSRPVSNGYFVGRPIQRQCKFVRQCLSMESIPDCSNQGLNMILTL